jgi:iron complex outermembrane receptor protein
MSTERASAAEPTNSGALDEIIVTAEKRSENILDVPMSITAISAQTIEQAGIVGFMDYALKIPNLTFGYADGQGVVNSRSIAIRGVQGLSTTGFYLNDVPLPDGVNPFTADLARVEVLRGPQGTLYGARSMGGTVRLITDVPDPSGFSGMLHQSVSTLNDAAVGGYAFGYQTDMSVNAPLWPNAAARVTAFTLSDPGWLERRFPSTTNPGTYGTVSPVATKYEYGATVALLWNVTSDLTLKPTVIYQNSSYNGMPLGDYVPSNEIQERLFNIPEGVYDEWTDASLVANWRSRIGEVTSVSSYFYSASEPQVDAS